MDLEEEFDNEYHDPDYPEEVINENTSKPDELEKIDKIKAIIKREFDDELEYKQKEIDEIDQRMTVARRMLHRLRVAVVERYYHNPKLMLSETQVQECIAEQPEPQGKAEAAAILRNKQKRIHPSLRKLLGRQEVNFDEIFKFRPPRNKSKKDSSVGKLKNVTISHSGTIEKSLRPESPGETLADGGKSPISHIKTESADSEEKPTKTPRHLQPQDNKKVLKINEVTRNQQKHKFRIIIGNTSKYAPASSSVDRSTHRWLLYIRGPRHAPDLSKILSHVTVRLHHTYSPHDLVHIREPPFHVSRRGWGEFPASVELHFTEPSRNPPATISHTVKLDRQYTGAQMLGAETVVDVYLYATKEMLDSIVQSPIKQSLQSTVSNENQTKAEMNVDKSTRNENCIEKSQVRSEKTYSSTQQNSTLVKNAIKTVFKQEIIDDSFDKQMTNGIEDPSNHKLQAVSKLKVEDDMRESIDIKTEPELRNTNDLTIAEKPKSRLVKCRDSNTGRVCYLKMDVELDVKSVQSIIINNTIPRPTSNDIKGPPGIHRQNSLKKSTRISLLKPEVNRLIQNDASKIKFTHIANDHSYLGTDWGHDVLFVDDGKSRSWFTTSANETGSSRKQLTSRDALSSKVKRELELVDASESLLGDLCLQVKKMADVRTAVAFLLKNVPLISNMAIYSKFQSSFPFAVQSNEIFFELNFAKRRNIEWSRAKMIEKMLKDNMTQFSQKPWSPRQILTYARLHGYYPVNQDTIDKSIGEDMWLTSDDYESKTLRQKNIRNCLKDVSFINTSTKFHKDSYYDEKLQFNQEILRLPVKMEAKNNRVTIDDIKSGLSEDSDEEIEIVQSEEKKDEKSSPFKKRVLEVLPIDNEDDKMRCFFIEKKCAEVGLELRNEDVGDDYSYSLVHMVMLSALKSFTEEILRASLCQKKLTTQKNRRKMQMWENKLTDTPSSIELHHVYKALQQNERLHIMTKQGLATNAIEYNEGV